MTETRPDEDTIRDVAGRVASTAHPKLDDATIDQAIEIVEDVEERLETDERDDAVEDLLVFWDGYIAGGLLAVTDSNSIDASTPRDELIRRGNDADLYGLDVYQALLKLAEAYDESAEEGRISERTVNWASRVADLTTGFVGHLDDHK